MVAPKFGLINFASLFCYSDVERRRAVTALLPLEGIDAIAWRDGEDVRVTNQHGTARISRKGGEGESLFRYQPDRGRSAGRPARCDPHAGAGNVRRRRLRRRTGPGSPPPAICRCLPPSSGSIAACIPNAINTADLVISMADGYYYGDRTWEKFVKLHGTHGGLSREEYRLVSDVLRLRGPSLLPPAGDPAGDQPAPGLDAAHAGSRLCLARPVPARDPIAGFGASQDRVRRRETPDGLAAGSAGSDHSVAQTLSLAERRGRVAS